MMEAGVVRAVKRRAAVLGLLLATVLLVDGLLAAKPSEAAFPGENGRIVFSSERDTATNPEKDAEIFTMNPDGTRLVQLTQNDGIPDLDPVFSPDGTQIAFAQTESGGGNVGGDHSSKIFVMNANGTGKRQLTPDSEFARDPAWSPDGKEIAYSELGSINSKISARNAADGTGKRIIVDSPGQSRHPAWSPDGDEIVFENNKDGDFEIFTVVSTGGLLEERITTNSLNDHNPAYSPDGERIAFSSPRNGTTESKREILVVDFSGGCCTLRQMTTNTVRDDAPTFSPDGTKIVFGSDRGGISPNNEIITMDSRTGAGGTNITNSARADLSPDWQPGNITVFTVNHTGDLADADPGDALCDADPSVPGRLCTLRAAIQQANVSEAGDTIVFDIPTSAFGVGGGCSRTGACTISPKSPLPAIIDPTVIDGYTQRGASPNTLAKGTNAVLKIELNGSGAGAASGLKFFGDGSVRGLAINRFSGSGVVLGTGRSTIAGNFIGTNLSGTQDLGNGGAGVSVNGAGFGASFTVTTIGGGAIEDRNLISGNGRSGVEFDVSQFAVVGGNLIGTDKSGTAALGNDGNGVIMSDRSFNLTVGGPTPSTANTIAFNGADGVGAPADASSVDDNSILGNSIFSNGGLGIDLEDDGPTPNDPGDGDFGSNGLQNKPVITSVTTTGSTTTGSGNLNSTSGKTFDIQFFSNPSGNEGRVFRGEISVTTNAQGDAPFIFGFPVAIPAGQTVTATATDPEGNTSEFSAPRKVVAQ